MTALGRKEGKTIFKKIKANLGKATLSVHQMAATKLLGLPIQISNCGAMEPSSKFKGLD